MEKERQYIESVADYLKSIEDWVNTKNSTPLFRGQNTNDPLIPKIARKDCRIDTSDLEREMLEEFKRRTAQDKNLVSLDDWDLLVYAQHYGLATRLLDWTTNPLVALWFACRDLDKDHPGYIYLLFVTKDMILNKKDIPDPFVLEKTIVFKPKINNPRIAAQSGWFTAHRYSRGDKKFVDLHEKSELQKNILMKGVNPENKKGILSSLDKLGINSETLFSGLDGTCKYLNWCHEVG